jgi:pyridoxal phosphate enzyme (YggS family)
MNIIIDRYNKIKDNIKKIASKKSINIIAVTKTFSMDHINPLLNAGHIHFGENKVQEANSKWLEIKKKTPNLKLHMIGKLQSNKVKKAVELFDYIHSLDNQKLAITLSKNEKILNKHLKYFIQVNVGSEMQKSGIPYGETEQFFYYCVRELNLNVIGLMCIPPHDEYSEKYFKNLSNLNITLNLEELSIGMSNDYMKAASNNATFLRIGSAIFGNRS